jgi:flavin reductase (DIM6/NTAB) family NADH-FMN oxidoreductase RutF
MLEFEPPFIGCVVSSRDFTFKTLKVTKQCVINIPTSKILKAVVGCGNTSGKTVDKFTRYKLTAIPAQKVKAPLIAQCYANLECRLVDAQLEKKYNFFVLEVIKAWVDPVIKNPKTIHHRGEGLFMIAGRSLQTLSKMK